MKSFLTLGEPLVVFSSNEKDIDLMNTKHFTKYLAGAELNVAVGVSRLGIESAYISSVGADPFGEFVLKAIKENKISTKYLNTNKDYWTGFYLKQQVTKGDPEVFYYRKNSAASHFEQTEFDHVDFSNIGLIHNSGIMAGISEQGFKAVEKLMDLANEKSIITTFDPNIRKPLWDSEEIMINRLNYLAGKAQVVLPGINEGKILIGTDDPEEIADFYLNGSDITNTVIVKLGAKGAYVKNKQGLNKVISGYKVTNVIDTVGAGDGFAVGLITGLLEGENIEEATKRACAIGAMAVQSAGDSEGYPNREELEDFTK